jgi:hypothetical protein
MAYALLIVETPGDRQLRSETQGRERYERMVRFSEDLKDRGLLTLSEAKEMIGGFLLLTCGSREQAIAIARECPAAGWATVEVREVGPCVE